MRKITLFLLLAVSVSAFSQVTMRDCFLKMPHDVMPYLSENNRLDCLDFIDSKMDAKVKNVFDNEITLDTLTSQYLSMSLGEGCRVEMRLFPLSADSAEQVLCIATTYGDSVRESSLHFYNPQTWRPIAADSLFSLPVQHPGEMTAYELPKEGTLLKLTTYKLTADEKIKYDKTLTSINFIPANLKKDK